MNDLPAWARRGRGVWRFTGRERPSFARDPGPGQESVWDYPRPPRVAPDVREVLVRAGDIEIARTREAVRVLETARPPTFYLPRSDVRTEILRPCAGGSACEWKGVARYWTVLLPALRLGAVAWSYPDPFPEFDSIKDYLSFYPARVDCFVAGLKATPQPGGFYGGWVTPEVVGPFKGERGSEGW